METSIDTITVELKNHQTAASASNTPQRSNSDTKDALIIRQVSFKGAIEIVCNKIDLTPYDIEPLTNIFEKIINKEALTPYENWRLKGAQGNAPTSQPQEQLPTIQQDQDIPPIEGDIPF